MPTSPPGDPPEPDPDVPASTLPDPGSPTPRPPFASIIVPAHDEERVIGRLLTALTGHDPDAEPGGRPGPAAEQRSPATGEDLEIVVVCNGCHDRTAEVARAFGPRVRVEEVPEPSKARALRHGDRVASCFPRAYIDADVRIDGQSVRQLAAALSADGVHAVGPRRTLDLRGAPWIVRWYYDVWQRLPQVRSGLFGRGVVMVSAEGGLRLAALPEVMSDDLAMSEAFAPDERRVVEQAHVVVVPPRTVRDLVRRRVRATTGNAQADALGVRHAQSRTTWRTLFGMAVSDPVVARGLPVFLAVTLTAQLISRRARRSGDYTTWLRDESSRQ